MIQLSDKHDMNQISQKKLLKIDETFFKTACPRKT